MNDWIDAIPIDTTNVATVAHRTAGTRQNSATAIKPATLNHTIGGVFRKHSAVYSAMPARLASTLTEYALIPFGAASRYQPTSCPTGMNVIAIRMNSGNTMTAAMSSPTHAFPVRFSAAPQMNTS